ncbi:MAG TPA: amidohydrolase family protein [Acidimicrobiales bacterium]|nr:amidohydrolase family protein [Acidimicrobiales bacterium]
MLDCAVIGGTIIDGTGAPGRQADVGIRDRRIVAITEPGGLDEPTAKTIDATGLVVTPGFVDIHTHYDAQLFWDPTASPSPLHGVTTVVGGNCGFTVAPLEPTQATYLMRMLARVEGMPLASLEAGVPWDWRTFDEYLARLDGTVAVNAGFLVGHSAIRRAVMGDDGVGSAATPAQIDAMVRLLHESLTAGGLGFSSSQAPTHNDGDGDPVPSRSASREELLALAGALRDHPGTSLEFIPTIGPFGSDHIDLMAAMSLAANRPLNWNVLGVNPSRPENHRNQLGASDYAAERGATVLALTVPDTMRFRLNFLSGFIFDAIPGWAETMALPKDAKMKALSDPDERRRLRDAAASPTAGPLRGMVNWPAMSICETFADVNKGLAGRTVADVAEQRGQDPFDAVCDIALADELLTSLAPRLPADEPGLWQTRAELWRDPRVLLGASDAGAHLDMIDSFTYTTALLGQSVRDRQLLGLEEAIHLLTDRPARIYGMTGRGRLAPGWYADLVVLDPDRIGPAPVHTRYDLPGGAGRLYAEADGIEWVLVNGTPIVQRTAFTGDRPGQLLRSGRDTETVEAGSI